MNLRNLDQQAEAWRSQSPPPLEEEFAVQVVRRIQREKGRLPLALLWMATVAMLASAVLVGVYGTVSFPHKPDLPPEFLILEGRGLLRQPPGQ